MKQLLPLSKPILVVLIVLNACTAFAHYQYVEEAILVVDEEDLPLIGVHVSIPSLDFKAVTDLSGKFTLHEPPPQSEIIFSYTGYEPLRIPFINIKESGWKVRLRPDPKMLETIVVVGRRGDSSDELVNAVQSISQKELAFSNAATAADALDKLTDVFVQKSQMGGGSPIIRGFEANRVLLVLDGVRMNNAIYRNGHLQNAITVDNAMLEQAEEFRAFRGDVAGQVFALVD